MCSGKSVTVAASEDRTGPCIMSYDIKSTTRVLPPVLKFREGLCRGRFLFQTFQHRSNDYRQTDGRVHKHFAKLAAFRRRHKLAPRNRFAVRTAGKAAPEHRLRADSQSIVIALQRQVFPAPAMAQFDERTELLRPVARNASANRENAQPLLTEQRGGKIFEVFEGIEAEPRLAFFVTFAIGQRIIEAKFGIRERGHKYRNIFLVGGF